MHQSLRHMCTVQRASSTECLPCIGTVSTEWHTVNKTPCFYAIHDDIRAIYLPVLDPPWQHTAVGQPCSLPVQNNLLYQLKCVGRSWPCAQERSQPVPTKET